MTQPTHYETLNVSSKATSEEIKQAYRSLVKKFHPDSQSETSDHEKIVEINAAYEVIGDAQRRQSYDQHLAYQQMQSDRLQQQATASQKQYRQQRQAAHNADEQLELWLKQVYVPVNRFVARIVNPLAEQVDELAADPFDDELMEAFQDYLKQCRDYLNQAQLTFRSYPNPPVAAGAAVHLYYCLNQISDGIDDLEMFTHNYDDHYLHTGQELFRIATGLRREAQETIKSIA